jgi:hypothetical protein
MEAYMLVVKKGTINHNGKRYAMGEILPDMSETDAARLIKLDIAAEVADKSVSEKVRTKSNGSASTPGAAENDVDLSFSPDASIKGKK